jgi:integrase
VVLTPAEVGQVLGFLRGTHHLVGLLLYGGGLRLAECLSLRVKDVDLGRRELMVRRRKAGKDRLTVLPESAREALEDQLRRVKLLHERDMADGHGWVELPREG